MKYQSDQRKRWHKNNKKSLQSDKSKRKCHHTPVAAAKCAGIFYKIKRFWKGELRNTVSQNWKKWI